MIEEVHYFWKFLFQNCSSGQVEWKHFGKPDENSWTEGRKTYAHCPKVKKEIKVDEKFFPQKRSYGHFKGNFVNPVGTSSLEGQNF